MRDPIYRSGRFDNGWPGGGCLAEFVLLLLAFVFSWFLFQTAQSGIENAIQRGDFTTQQSVCEQNTTPIQSRCATPFIQSNKLHRETQGSPVERVGMRKYDISRHVFYPLSIGTWDCSPTLVLILLLVLFIFLPAVIEESVALLYQNLHDKRRRCLAVSRPFWVFPCLYILLCLGLLLMYSVEPWVVLFQAKRVLINVDRDYLVSALKASGKVLKYQNLFETHAKGVFLAIVGVCVAQEAFSWYRIRSLLERIRTWVFLGLFFGLIMAVMFLAVSSGANRTSAIAIPGLGSFTTADIARVLLLFAALRFFVQRGALELIDRYADVTKEGRFRTLFRHKFFIVLLLSTFGIAVWFTSGQYAWVKALLGIGFLIITLRIGFRNQWWIQFGFLALVTALACVAWILSRDFGAILIIVPVLLLLSLFRIRHPLITVAAIAAIIGGTELLYYLDNQHGLLRYRFVERIEHVRDPFSGAPNSHRRAANSDVPARILWTAKEGGWSRLKLGDNARVAKIPEIDTDLTFAFFSSSGGMLGGLLVIVLYTGLFAGLFRIAGYQRLHEHAYWTVIGVSLLLAWQTALNIGATLSIFPLTGIPLTFIGRGTVAMLMNGLLVGLVLGYRGGFASGRVYETAKKGRHDGRK